MKHLLTFLLLSILAITGSFSTDTFAQDGADNMITPENVHELVKLDRFGHGTRDAFAWTADESLLAVGGSLGVWLYDGQNLEAEPRLVPNSPANVHHLAFNGAGTQIAIGWGLEDGEQGLIVLDVETGETVLQLDDTVSGDPGLQFSADGTVFVAQTARGVLVWDMATLTELFVLRSSTGAALSPDGKWLAVNTPAVAYTDVLIFDLETAEERIFSPDDFRFGGPMGPAIGLMGVAFTEYEGEIVLATMHEEEDHVNWLWVMRYWELSTGAVLERIETGSGLYDRNQSIPAEDRVLASSITWNSTTPFFGGSRPTDLLPDPMLSFTLLSVLPSRIASNDDTLITGDGSTNAVNVWNLANGEHVYRLLGDGCCVRGLALKQDSTLLAVGMDEDLNIWRLSADETATPELISIPTSHTSSITQLGFNQASTRLVTRSNREIVTWDLTDVSQPTEISKLVVDQNRIYLFAFDSISGNYAYKNGFEGAGLQLADAETGAVIRHFEDVDTSYHSLAFSPDGSRLYGIGWSHEGSGSDAVYSGQVIAWDVETGEFLGALTDPIVELSWLTISPEGSLIIAVSSLPDVGATAFDAATGEVLFDFEATGVPLFNADASRLFMANIGVIDVWGLPDSN